MRLPNFSASEGGSLWFCERLLEAIAREAPRSYLAIALALGARVVLVDVDGDVFRLSMASGRHLFSAGRGGAPAVEVRMGREAVVGLLEARYGLVDAVLRGDVLIRGAAADLAAFDDVLSAVVRGAARAVSAPALLDAYLMPAPSVDARPRVRRLGREP